MTGERFAWKEGDIEVFDSEDQIPPLPEIEVEEDDEEESEDQ